MIPRNCRGQMRAITLVSPSPQTQVFLVRLLDLWILPTLSGDATSSLPLTINEPVIGLAHLSLEMPRGIGEHSMQTGMIRLVVGFATCPYPLSSKHRFADRDAFARFSGIGIGCQQMQATRALKIVIGLDAPDPVDLAADEFDESLFEGCYTIDDDRSDEEP